METNFAQWQDKVRLSSAVAIIVEKEPTEKRVANPRLKMFNYQFKN